MAAKWSVLRPARIEARACACRSNAVASAASAASTRSRLKRRGRGSETSRRTTSPPCPPCSKHVTRFKTVVYSNSSFNPMDAGVGYAMNKAAEVVDDFSRRRRKPEYNGTFALVLVNIVMFALGKVMGPQVIRPLMLANFKPQWYQFITSIFCHANWQHLSGNLFLLFVFGKLVEEEEGVVGVVLTYFICGICGAAASMAFGPKQALSLGASGAVFGLFVVSVLVRLSFNPKKLIESAIVGQYVFEQVKNEVKMQAGRMGNKLVGNQVSHAAHLGGALAGVILILAISRLPASSGKKK